MNPSSASSLSPAIEVEGLSKHYVISGAKRATTLRDALSTAARELTGAWRRDEETAAAEQASSFWALSDVSFSVAPGDVLGIVGRNGAGKSTLLKILSRITEPTSGRAILRGRVASLLEVGTGFHPELTGRENIFFNGAVLGLTRAEVRARFDEIVAFADVDRFLDTPMKRYSSGMQMRLAFAVAAHLEPEILIIDEVLAVGDLAFQKKCLGKMKSISHQEGRTVLFVSHNLHAIRQLCRSALLLQRGKVALQGSVESVLNGYISTATSADVASCPPPSADLLERAFALSVILETSGGQPAVELAVGESWSLRLRFRVVRPLDAVTVTLSVVTMEGTPLQTAWSAPQSLSPGDHEVRFIQDKVILEAGTYALNLTLSDQDRKLQQFEGARLQISNEGRSGHFPVTSDGGLVLGSMTVSGPAQP